MPTTVTLENQNKSSAGIDPGFFMQKQFEITFDHVPSDQKDLLIAKLFELGIHGMEEQENGILAYAIENEFNQEDLSSYASMIGLKYSLREIEQVNWNALWESNFEPVIIPGKVYVRAGFHSPAPEFEYDIVITPKMSFGTGHHATTMMMMRLMLDLDFKDKYVIDFGSGTGILSILAEKLGATQIEAVDNEPWSVENAMDNAVLNNCHQVKVMLGSSLDLTGKADILLANINKSILQEHAKHIFRHLQNGGLLIISGLLSYDYNDICQSYTPFFGEPLTILEEGEWIALLFKKPVNVGDLA